VLKKNYKTAIEKFHNEVQSAQLPEIMSAVTGFKSGKAQSTERARKNKNITVDMVDKEKKEVEYIHEEFFDAERNGKWTIFNKHAIEIEKEESDIE